MLFDIKQFISLGSFFPGLSNKEILPILESKKDDVFGEPILMYYFYYSGYNINIIYDQESEILTGQQVEILDKSVILKDSYLSSILSIELFHKEFSLVIDSIYSDGDELVIFLENGVNVFFNEKFISKITSPDEFSRKFIKDNFRQN